MAGIAAERYGYISPVMGRRRGVGSALVLAIAVVGCGGDNKKSASASVVADAAAKTSGAGTARFSETVRGSADGTPIGPGSVRGVVDGKRSRASIEIDLRSFARPGGPDADALQSKVVYFGSVAFVSGPALEARLPKRKRWVKVAAARLQNSGLGGGIVGMGALDPTKPVDFLRGATGAVEEIGREPVNGRPTKHYRTEVDYRLYLRHVPADRRAALEAGITRLDSLLSTTKFPVEAWIADDGTIRRIRGRVEGGPLKQTYTLDLTAIGEPLDVRPPPRAQVVDAGNL